MTRALLEQALDALTCFASEDGYGHACGRCDESIDSSGELRAAIRAELAKPETYWTKADEAYDNYYHKVRADMGRDDWRALWVAERTPHQVRREQETGK